MKIKNSEIVQIFNGIPSAMKKQLPVKVSYAIGRNMKMLEPIANAHEAERMKIIEKYVEKDDKGEIIVRGNEVVLTDKEGYAREIGELLEIENEVQVHTIPFSLIEECDSERFDVLTPAELSAMSFMIEE